MLRFIFILVTVTSLGYSGVVDIKNGITNRKLESESISEVIVRDVKANKTVVEQSPNDKFARPIIVEPVVAEEEITQKPTEIINKNDKFARPPFVKNTEVTPDIDPKYQPILDPRSHPINSEHNSTQSFTTLKPPNDKFVSEEYLQQIYANRTEVKPIEIKTDQKLHPNDKFVSQEYIQSIYANISTETPETSRLDSKNPGSKETDRNSKNPEESKDTDGNSKSPEGSKDTAGNSKSSEGSKDTDGNSKSSEGSKDTAGNSKNPEESKDTAGNSKSPEESKDTVGNSKNPGVSKDALGNSRNPGGSKDAVGNSKNQEYFEGKWPKNDKFVSQEYLQSILKNQEETFRPVQKPELDNIPIFTVHDASISPEVDPSVSAEYDPVSSEVDPNSSGGNPNSSGGNPNSSGGNPNSSGGNPNSSGGNPNSVGGKPNSLGYNQNSSEGNPNSVGDNPNSSGDNPNSSGGNPNSLGVDPNSLGVQNASNFEVLQSQKVMEVYNTLKPQKPSLVQNLSKPPNSPEEHTPKLPNPSENTPNIPDSAELYGILKTDSLIGHSSVKLLNSTKKEDISKRPNSGNLHSSPNSSVHNTKLPNHSIGQNTPKLPNLSSTKPPNASRYSTSKPLSPSGPSTLKPSGSSEHGTFKPRSPSGPSTLKPPSSSGHSTFKPPSSSGYSTVKPPSSSVHSTFKPPSSPGYSIVNPPNPPGESTAKPSNPSNSSTHTPNPTEVPKIPPKPELHNTDPILNGSKPIIAGMIPNDKFVTQEYIESIKNKVRQEITSEITKLHEESPIQKYVDSLTSNFDVKSANMENPCESQCNDDDVVIYKQGDIKDDSDKDEYVRFVNRKIDEEPAKKREVDEDDQGINFTFLRGANIPCSTSVGNMGTCLPFLVCKEMNGTNGNSVHNNNGGCGVLPCCEISKGCSETISTKVGYFKSPPEVESSCRLSVKAFNQNVCQIRLDFEEFRLASPSQQVGSINSAISCKDDSMVIISPNGLTTPILCGSMKGQHIYVPINTTDGEMAVQLVMNLGPRPGLLIPHWKIKITQLECPVNPDVVTSGPVMKNDFVALAPPGCLQYFTEPQGTVCNFGYDREKAAASNSYIANHKYAICFKRRPNNCGIRFTSSFFEMSGKPNDCSGDYLFIPGAEMRSSGNINIKSSYCEKMITPDSEVISMLPGPFNIQFITDNVGSAEERGWCLNYRIFSTGNCL